MTDSIYSPLELMMGYDKPHSLSLTERLKESAINTRYIAWDTIRPIAYVGERVMGRMYDSRFNRTTFQPSHTFSQVALNTWHPIDKAPIYLFGLLTSRDYSLFPWLVFSSRFNLSVGNLDNPVGLFLTGDEMMSLFNDTRGMSDSDEHTRQL